MPGRFLLMGLLLLACRSGASASLGPERLGIIFDSNDAASGHVARYYALRRHIPAANLIGLPLPNRPAIDRAELKDLRSLLLLRLPSEVQSLLLVWSRPYAVECMSITTAFAAGYSGGFCEPGCGTTTLNPLFDSKGWLPADTAGWLPAMLLPSDDERLARAVIDRGIAADGSHPPGTVYLVRTRDSKRNVRAEGFGDAEISISERVGVRELEEPIGSPPRDIIGYFTGTVRPEELPALGFRSGAAADHLTSSGGVLYGSSQMSALEWLKQGATASYGTVSEPCNRREKFPDPKVLFDHYLRGEPLLPAYWKSVAMPGQGLFLGEPLASPFGPAAGG